MMISTSERSLKLKCSGACDGGHIVGAPHMGMGPEFFFLPF